MTRALGYILGLILIWYVALTYGCITAHHPDDVSVENPPSNDELKQSVLAIKCLVPEPTAKGIAIAVVTSFAAAYLGCAPNGRTSPTRPLRRLPHTI